MPICRGVIRDACHALKVTTPGEDPNIDELTAGLDGLHGVLLELHDARGPLINIDVPGTIPAGCPPPSGYIAGENQRIRIQAGNTIVVTLPNSVARLCGYDPYDYGFHPYAEWPQAGSTCPADDIYWFAPQDGARIEIVGATAQLFFYRADINQWLPAYGLTLDSELPLNARYSGAVAAMLADRLMDVLAGAEPTPGLEKRAARGKAALMAQTGRHARPTRIHNL